MDMHIDERLNRNWECSVKCSCTPGHHVVRLVDGSDEVVKCRHCGESKTHDKLIKEYVARQSQKGKGVWPRCYPGYTRVWPTK